MTKSFIHQEEKGVGKVFFLLSGFFTSSGRGDSYAWGKTPGGEVVRDNSFFHGCKKQKR